MNQCEYPNFPYKNKYYKKLCNFILKSPITAKKNTENQSIFDAICKKHVRISSITQTGTYNNGEWFCNNTWNIDQNLAKIKKIEKPFFDTLITELRKSKINNKKQFSKTQKNLYQFI